jgi:hypothetical protein
VTITEEDLARLETLAQAATPGPWDSDGITIGAGDDQVADIWGDNDFDGAQCSANGRFIVAACEAVPALVAEVRRQRVIEDDSRRIRTEHRIERDALRAENERLRSELADAEHTINGGPHEGGLSHKVARLEAENERLHTGMSTAVHETERYWSARVAERVCERDTAIAEAAELRASLADAVGRMEHALDIVSAARWHRHGYGKDPTKMLHDAVDAYEASLPGIVKVKP